MFCCFFFEDGAPSITRHSIKFLKLKDLRVPFLVSFCQFSKAIIIKTFNEIVLVFLPVESKTNTLYVNINFTGNLFFGFGRYCGKVAPEPAVSHRF